MKIAPQIIPKEGASRRRRPLPTSVSAPPCSVHSASNVFELAAGSSTTELTSTSGLMSIRAEGGP